MSAEIKKNIKRKVIEDWQCAFPDLTVYSQDKLYKILGPIIVGLELTKLPRVDEYRPHFVMYSLLGNGDGSDINSCLSFPTILKEFYNSKRMQYSIPYLRHDEYFKDVTSSVKDQLLLPLKGNVTLNSLLKIMDQYSKQSPMNFPETSYRQAVFSEFKMKIASAVCVGEAERILKELQRINWNRNNFNAFGIDVDQWLESLKKVITENDRLLDTLESNKQNRKIAKLQTSELTL